MLPEFLHPWVAVITTVAIFVAINVRRSTPLDLLFLGGLMIVALAGVLDPGQALRGFASPAVLTIAGLLAISAALRITGVLDWVGHRLLGTAHNERTALVRLAIALVSSSAFLLNTALVAMMAPVVVNWCRQRRIAPSRLLIPVSYLSILGGVCTLIGTSTTLVVQAKLQASYAEAQYRQSELAQQIGEAEDLAERAQLETEVQTLRRYAHGVRPMPLLEIGKVGLPCALVGTLVLVLFGPRLLPRRQDMFDSVGENRREYLVEMQVRPECRLVGKDVEAGGLRHLPGLFLIEIDRGGNVITPVVPEEVIQAYDRLVFSGVVETIVDLEKIPGLVPVEADEELEKTLGPQRNLTEVVLSPSSPLIRTTVRTADFRERYGAAVVAVHRNGEHVTNKIGDIVLRPGDTLLLQTSHDFSARYGDHRDFYLVSAVKDSERRRHERMPLAGMILLGLLTWLVVTSLIGDAVTQAWASPAIAALVTVGILVVTRCMRMVDARSAIDIRLLTTIACALGLGLALEESGAALAIAQGVIELVGASQPMVLLIILYILTMIMTEMITNNAVAALMYPIAVNLATTSGHDPRPFVMAVCLAASLAFITPIGYQTNLMVMGPGGYRPIDFVRCGVPVSFSVAVTAILLIPVFWPFAL